MTTNNVVTNAVAAVVAELSKQTLEAGVSLVNRIRSEQSKIEDCATRIKAFQKELQALNEDQFTVENVYGGSLPQTANSDTIGKVIAAMNKARQFPVEQKSQRLVSAITAEHDAIAAIEKRIAELRNELTKLDVPAISVESIVS